MLSINQVLFHYHFNLFTLHLKLPLKHYYTFYLLKYFSVLESLMISEEKDLWSSFLDNHDDKISRRMQVMAIDHDDMPCLHYIRF